MASPNSPMAEFFQVTDVEIGNEPSGPGITIEEDALENFAVTK